MARNRRGILIPEQFRAQIEVNLFGTLNVTRAVLAVMRPAALGPHHHDLVNGGARLGSRLHERLRGVQVRPRGMDGGAPREIAPFGIQTTVVNPGFFRTELLSEQSTRYAEPAIADDDARRAPLLAAWKATHG